MTTQAPSSTNEARKLEILRAATDILRERGFGDARIADVAKRASVSTGLVIYYFGSREQLLIDALRYWENGFYETAQQLLEGEDSAARRLRVLVAMACGCEDTPRMSWGLWFELWAQAQRHPEAAEARSGHDEKWRNLITEIVRHGQRTGEFSVDVDARRFALMLATLLDGMMVQVGLDDRELNSDLAFDLSMEFVSQQLGMPAQHG
ncbi:TetR/AcrR family transcriptional regulator [Rhodococcus sp. NPDC057529]|uniref:TetR/AcrR family transcriptional regulator n=1 Tax=Rhodococcus sp. NPDC057529 TaxID=3346158 RepID=UPI003671A371